MTVLDAIIKHMEDNNLDTANGINICQLIDDHDIDVLPQVAGLVNSWRDMKKDDK
tara:strand:- start:24 stop:188 length:165 start_codon:yes stop_codon:yes gene_type:complete